MSTGPKKPFVATGGNVSASKLPRFVNPSTRILIDQRAQGRVKPPTFRGQDTGRLRGHALQRLRAKMFALDPLCAECRRQGRIRKWDQLDHIKPREQGGTDDESNLQGLCYECHQIKTAREIAESAAIGISFRKPPGGD